MSYSRMDINEVSNYLRIKGGEVAHIHILTRNPKVETIHWIDKKKITCSKKSCVACKDGDRPKQRFLINVYDRKDKRMKIFEFGISIAKSIKSIAQMLDEMNQTVHDVDFAIKAEGSGIDTEYTVMQRPKVPGDMQYMDEFTEDLQVEGVPF